MNEVVRIDQPPRFSCGRWEAQKNPASGEWGIIGSRSYGHIKILDQISLVDTADAFDLNRLLAVLALQEPPA